MRKLLLIGMLLCAGLAARAQEDVFQKVKEANLPSTLEAAFVQTRHSELLSEDLVSRGRVWLQQPDKVRWEVTSPKPRLTVFNGEVPRSRKFRLPSEKDFKVTVLTSKELTLLLEPLRGDFRQLFTQIILKADSESFRVRSILLKGLDGDTTLIEFQDIRTGMEIDPKLFVKE